MQYLVRVQAETSSIRSLGELLRRANYSFVTVTPETHRRVNERAAQQGQTRARNLRDVFGWNRPFDPGDRSLMSAEVMELLREGRLLEETEHGLRSRVRYSTLGELLCAHSGFPTQEADAVFFGPDTYRFCHLLARWAPPARRAVDVGCGTGAGGLSIASRIESLVLADLNPRALAYAEVNTALAARTASIVRSDVLANVDEDVDLVIANPPYMRDPAGRLYRDGGDAHGTQLAVRIVRESLERLGPGGTLIVYTGAPIVDGQDIFHQAVLPYLDKQKGHISYEHIDPDVFGDELERPAYAEVERIAAVGLRVSLAREP